MCRKVDFARATALEKDAEPNVELASAFDMMNRADVVVVTAKLYKL